MDKFSKTISIRWADIDANFHLRHSAYYDFGAQQRMEILEQTGLTMQVMQAQSLGPILLREECVFKREIKFGDELEVFLKLSKCNEDASRWSMVHELWTNGNTLAALITIDGAWIDTSIRKLAKPPEVCILGIKLIPKAENYNQ